MHRVGIVGAGQLARMMVQAAIPLAVPITLLAERPTDGAALVGADVLIGQPTDPEALLALARRTDVVTFDHELVDVEALLHLEAEGYRVLPGSHVISLAQDKARQRSVFAEHGFPVPPFQPITDWNEIDIFARTHGWPIVAKAIRGGYDGRGVWVLDDAEEARTVFNDTHARGVPLMVETWVPIEREIAVQVARRASGETAVYPVVETVQADGICRELRVPAPIPPSLADAARGLAVGIAEAIGAVGMLAVELFVTSDETHGQLIVNEIAARPHNSGHWTIEGSDTSQFAQHVRAVLDLPLGATTMRAPSVVTVNILGAANADGDPAQRLPEALCDPDVAVHLYGKESRPGRKIGHVTILGDSLGDQRERAWRAADILAGEPALALG